MDSISNNFLSVVRSNDINKIQSYLQHNIPNQDELVSRTNSPQTLDDIRIFLATYYYLLTMNLQDYLSQDYYEKNINNFLVISSRGYLPLLHLKQEELPSVINTRSKDMKNALNYVLSDPNNIDVLIFLINNQIIVDDKSLNKIKDYSEKITDINLRYRYQQLYDHLVPEKQSLFSQLPDDVLIMITDNPKDIEKLCQSNRELYRTYCMNPNSEFWKKLYKNKYNIYPENIDNLSFKEQYETLYDLEGISITIKIEKAAKMGMKDILEKYISELDPLDDNKRIFDLAMKGAAVGGHNEIIEWMLRLGATDYTRAMIKAARGGYKDIVQWMLDLGAKDHRYAMEAAAEGGHKDIIQMMLALNANYHAYYGFVMEYAAKGGHKDIVQMILDLNSNLPVSILIKPNYNWSMKYAAKGGHKDIVQMMLDLGADNYNNIMAYAAIGGHKDIV